MERSETLTKLRGETFYPIAGIRDDKDSISHAQSRHLPEKTDEDRFPPSFLKSAPSNAQKLILCCLERDPSKRPSAVKLLSVSGPIEFIFWTVLLVI